VERGSKVRIGKKDRVACGVVRSRKPQRGAVHYKRYSKQTLITSLRYFQQVSRRLRDKDRRMRKRSGGAFQDQLACLNEGQGQISYEREA